ncbi:3-oxoacyl-ACP synthase [Winogradskyella pulchriflava]|uniref:3-oxoacyl-ACP synthase n=1 Tax=Winogradskyella pulchriflava TaxID=1110688 RepID=A0ABV6Q5D8_9FLAO
MNTKQVLYNMCQEYVNNRLETIKSTINDIEQGLNSETKSSAGDKHETGRAMLQLEREKAGQQLAEVQKLQELLQKIDLEKQFTKVALGSIVETSGLNYFIAISSGELTINDKKYYAISPVTPIAKQLLSKKVGDSIHFRSSTFVINKIE